MVGRASGTACSLQQIFLTSTGMSGGRRWWWWEERREMGQASGPGAPQAEVTVDASGRGPSIRAHVLRMFNF